MTSFDFVRFSEKYADNPYFWHQIVFVASQLNQLNVAVLYN